MKRDPVRDFNVVGLKNDDFRYPGWDDLGLQAEENESWVREEDESKSTQGAVLGLREEDSKSEPTIGLGRVTNEAQKQWGMTGRGRACVTSPS